MRRIHVVIVAACLFVVQNQNLTSAKAEVDRVSKGAEAFCRQNRWARVAPMAATGHDTIFAWECVGENPRITNAEQVDGRGFIANQWKRLDR
jgi:hypothetical protein